ncbi:hypothetical protein QFZ43_008689 [Streptomyces afghaniensis]|nr:hypothetical protein [Streptomyces afghaniensis]
MHVLIVEDEPNLAEAIRAGLRLEAIAADIAGDGDTALELLSVDTYDIAVLDRDIPGRVRTRRRRLPHEALRPIGAQAQGPRPPAPPQPASRTGDRGPAPRFVPPRGLPRRPLHRSHRHRKQVAVPEVLVAAEATEPSVGYRIDTAPVTGHGGGDRG